MVIGDDLHYVTTQSCVYVTRLHMYRYYKTYHQSMTVIQNTQLFLWEHIYGRDLCSHVHKYHFCVSWVSICCSCHANKITAFYQVSYSTGQTIQTRCPPPASGFINQVMKNVPLKKIIWELLCMNVCQCAQAAESFYDAFLCPYRLHLFGDGGYLLDFGPQIVSLLVHHLLQLQHHLSLLVLDMVCTHIHPHTHTHKVSGEENGRSKICFLFCEMFFCPSFDY